VSLKQERFLERVLSVVMNDESEKAILPSFRLISQAEENRGTFIVICVLFEIRFVFLAM
jgi:hypothetical protein